MIGTELPGKAHSAAMMLNSGLLVQAACIWEVSARKVGNVHPSASFSDMSHIDFLLSAAAIGPVWESSASSVGSVILEAVRRTKQLVGKNTNLGIILLLAPFHLAFGCPGERGRLFQVLAELDIANDARQAFEAIRLANPGGIGDVPEQDIRAEPTVTLLDAMKLGAEHDMIARQYATGYADVFDFGVPSLLAAFERFGSVEAAIIDSQLRWLARFPDSLIARKNGLPVAAQVQRSASEVVSLGGISSRAGRSAGVMLDRFLRSQGNRLNPGTTADLITACLFVALRENKITPTALFPWQSDEWL